MKSPMDIIIKPLITEKSNMDMALGKYAFAVKPDATKTEVRQAVEALFQVKVLSVNTMNMEGKLKRQGVHVGRRPDWKKAIVTIDTNPQADTYLAKGGKEVSNGRKYKSSIEEFGAAQ